jgi:hypothetical protein
VGVGIGSRRQQLFTDGLEVTKGVRQLEDMGRRLGLQLHNRDQAVVEVDGVAASRMCGMAEGKGED